MLGLGAVNVTSRKGEKPGHFALSVRPVDEFTVEFNHVIGDRFLMPPVCLCCRGLGGRRAGETMRLCG